MQVGDRASLARAFAARVEAESAAATSRDGEFSIALPGGSAAEALLPALVTAAVDWSRTDIFWVDERAVAPDHADSNYGLAKGLLLDRIPIPKQRVHRMAAEAAPAEYESTLRRALGAARGLDVALIGVGPDGHVCSLFPGHAALQAAGLVALVTDSPKPPPRRLTLTLEALRQSRLVVIAAFGEPKAGVIRAAREDPRSRLPVALAARAAREALYLLDPPAASRLTAQ